MGTLGVRNFRAIILQLLKVKSKKCLTTRIMQSTNFLYKKIEKSIICYCKDCHSKDGFLGFAIQFMEIVRIYHFSYSSSLQYFWLKKKASEKTYLLFFL